MPYQHWLTAPEVIPPGPPSPSTQHGWLHLVLPLFQILGIYVAGDLGDMTLYTNHKGRIIWFPRAPPTKPASDLQRMQRRRFGNAILNWRNLSLADKTAWCAAVKASGIDITSLGAWISLSMKPDPSGLALLQAHSLYTLPEPPPV